MNVATLELQLQANGNSYLVHTRFTPAGSTSVAELLDEPLTIVIDHDMLREHAHDSSAYGEKLSAMVFGNERMREALRRVQDATDGADAVLRLLLRLDRRSNKLNSVRWEMIHYPGRREPLVLSERLMFARVLDSRDTTATRLPERPNLRSLIVVAGPTDFVACGLPEVDVEGETGRASAGLKLLSTDVVPSATEPYATLSALIAYLHNEPHILYLVCHGRLDNDGETTLFLQDEHGRASPISGDAFVEAIVGQRSYRPLLVVLVACNGGGDGYQALAAVGPRLARAGVPAVIAMQAPIAMRSVPVFAAALFSGLMRDGRIDRALAEARGALYHGTHPLDWWVPVLWLRGDGRLWNESKPQDSVEAAQQLVQRMPIDSDKPLPAHATLPAGSRLPIARSRLFEGREAIMRQIVGLFRRNDAIVSITGLGGIGKTSLAAEFAHRFGAFFAGGVFWISFAEPSVITATIAECGLPGAMNLFSEASGLTLDDQAAAVKRAWEKPLPRLLIFDNCEDGGLLDQWRPTTGGARILLTSRRADWPQSGDVTMLELEPLSVWQSETLLRRYRPDLPADEPSIHVIARDLGGLALALHLAGSYLEHYRDSKTFGDPARFVSELQRNPLGLMEEFGPTATPTRHDPNLKRTFDVSYTRLVRSNLIDRTAIQLLARAAQFAPGEPILRDLLLATLAIQSDDRDGQKRAEDAVNRLIGLGLITRVSKNFLVLHPLLQMYVYGRAPIGEAQRMVVFAMAVASRAVEQGNAALLRPLEVHFRSVTALSLRLRHPLALELSANLGAYLTQVGNYSEAQEVFEQTLALNEEVFGPTSHQTANAAAILADLLHLRGYYDMAQSLIERAIAIITRTSGAESFGTAVLEGQLGVILYSQGKYAQAQELCERSLEHFEQNPQVDALQTAIRANNVALIRFALGNYKQAQTLFEKALAVHEQHLGANHPEIAKMLNNLAQVFNALGSDAEARRLQLRTVAIARQELGSNHPNTLLYVNNLAAYLLRAGDYNQAQLLLEEIIPLTTSILGESHGQTLMATHNLAIVHENLGNTEISRQIAEHILPLCEHSLGVDHPQTAQILLLHVRSSIDSENYDEAYNLLKRAIRILEEKHGRNHPDTASAIGMMGIIHINRQEYAQAQACLDYSFDITAQQLGPNHLQTGQACMRLALLSNSLGKYEAAVTLLERAIPILKDTLGSAHPETIMTMNILGNTYAVLQQIDKSIELLDETHILSIQRFGVVHPNTRLIRRNLVSARIYGLLPELPPSARTAIENDDAFAFNETLLSLDPVRLADVWQALLTYQSQLMELPLDAMLELASITHEVQIAVQKSIEQRDPVELAELKECLEEMAELAIQDVTLDSPWYVYAVQLRGLQHRIQGVLNTLNSN